MSRDTAYAHAVGRIRTIEKSFIDRSRFQRMIDSPGPEEACKVLVDAGYGYEGRTGQAWDYETLLGDEYKKTYRLLSEVTPQPEIIDMFLVRNDYHNVKVLLKGEFSGIKHTEILNDCSLVPANVKINIKD